MGKKKFRLNLYQVALLYKNYDVLSIGIFFLYAPHIYSEIKIKPSTYIQTKRGRTNPSTSKVLGLTLIVRQTRRPRIVNICSLF